MSKMFIITHIYLGEDNVTFLSKNFDTHYF